MVIMISVDSVSSDALGDVLKIKTEKSYASSNLSSCRYFQNIAYTMLSLYPPFI